MSTFKSRGLRGSAFEDLINATNTQYQEDHLAVVQKIPTPITPMKVDHDKSRITLAYFEKKSTVDYIGVVQGIPVCFDAKECHENTFPLANIHDHQIQFMTEFERQHGVAFILIYYTKLDKYYYMTYDKMMVFFDRAMSGGRKSFVLEELDEDYFFESEYGLIVPYLNMLDKDLEERKARN